MSLHLGKTEVILFGSAAKLKKCFRLEVKIGDQIITPKREVKYLGCVLDSNLTGEKMAALAHSKICNLIKFLARQADFLDTETLKMLAGALVQAHFDYAAVFWYSGISKKFKNKLQAAQNKLCRVILKVHPLMHLREEHYRKISFLKVEKRVTFLKLVMVFKILKKMIPQYLLEYYVFVREVHCHSTRASRNDIQYILIGLRVKWEKNIFYILALLLGINDLGVFKKYKLIVFLEGKLKNGCFIIDVLKFVW